MDILLWFAAAVRSHRSYDMCLRPFQKPFDIYLTLLQSLAYLLMLPQLGALLGQNPDNKTSHLFWEITADCPYLLMTCDQIIKIRSFFWSDSDWVFPSRSSCIPAASQETLCDPWHVWNKLEIPVSPWGQDRKANTRLTRLKQLLPDFWPWRSLLSGSLGHICWKRTIWNSLQEQKTETSVTELHLCPTPVRSEAAIHK